MLHCFLKSFLACFNACPRVFQSVFFMRFDERFGLFLKLECVLKIVLVCVCVRACGGSLGSPGAQGTLRSDSETRRSREKSPGKRTCRPRACEAARLSSVIQRVFCWHRCLDFVSLRMLHGLGEHRRKPRGLRNSKFWRATQEPTRTRSASRRGEPCHRCGVHSLTYRTELCEEGLQLYARPRDPLLGMRF